MLSSFYVEHLEKTIRRRSLSLVRTVPGHLMRTSEAKYEFSIQVHVEHIHIHIHSQTGRVKHRCWNG